jgi:hypothetical protein
MWTKGQTDTTKLIVAFRNFAKAPKKESFRILGVDGEINSTEVGVQKRAECWDWIHLA